MNDIAIAGHKVNPWVAGAVGVGGLGVIYFVYKQHAASSSTASGTGIDPVTGLPYSEDNTIDPLTGQTYLAEAQQYGSVQAAEQAIAAESAGTGIGIGTSTGDGSGDGSNGGGGGGGSGAAYATNAAWAQAVEAGLSDIGYSQTDVAAALGRYLGRLSVSSAQQSIILAAIAEYGNPPVGTFQIITAQGKPPVKTGDNNKAQIPNVVHLDAAQAEQVISSAGFKAEGVPAAKTGVVHYVTAQNPSGGTQEDKGTKVSLTVGVQVPNVIDKDVADAQKILAAAGLHSSVSIGEVKGQTHVVSASVPSAGTIVKLGSSVRLTAHNTTKTKIGK